MYAYMPRKRHESKKTKKKVQRDQKNKKKAEVYATPKIISAMSREQDGPVKNMILRIFLAPDTAPVVFYTKVSPCNPFRGCIRPLSRP